jgi:hypothetical protein
MQEHSEDLARIIVGSHCIPNERALTSAEDARKRKVFDGVQGREHLQRVIH